MDNIAVECAHYADNNPDISGVGVRISFYLQTFLLVLLVDRSWQNAPVALWTFIATSAGLVLAAIIIRDQLTLFQALQVSNLVWLANFGTFFALASYSQQKAESRKEKGSRRGYGDRVKFGAMAQSLVSMALTLYMWGTAKTFGPSSECSHLVKYIFFVIEVQAISVGRTVGLVVTSLFMAIYLLITLQELYAYRRSRNDHPKGILPTQSESRLTFPQTPGNSGPPIPPIRMSSLSVTNATPCSAPHEHRNIVSSNIAQFQPRTMSAKTKRRPKRHPWSSDLDPMLVGIIICQLMVFTYFIVSTELLLQRNSSSNGQWSFGQILALIVVIPSAFSLAEAMNEHGVKRLSKRKKREHKKREDPELAGGN